MPRPGCAFHVCITALLPVAFATGFDIVENPDFANAAPGTTVQPLDPGVNTITGFASNDDVIAVPVPGFLEVTSVRVEITSFSTPPGGLVSGGIVRAGAGGNSFRGTGSRNLNFSVNNNTGVLTLTVERPETTIATQTGVFTVPGDMGYIFTIETEAPGPEFTGLVDRVEGFVLPVGGSGVTVERPATDGATPPGPLGPVVYTWRQNGETFDPAEIGLEVDGPNLTVVDARPETAGEYTVTISTDFGSLESEPIYLVVLPGDSGGVDGADFNGDGDVDVFDLIDFLVAFAAG